MVCGLALMEVVGRQGKEFLAGRHGYPEQGKTKIVRGYCVMGRSKVTCKGVAKEIGWYARDYGSWGTVEGGSTYDIITRGLELVEDYATARNHGMSFARNNNNADVRLGWRCCLQEDWEE